MARHADWLVTRTGTVREPPLYLLLGCRLSASVSRRSYSIKALTRSSRSVERQQLDKIPPIQRLNVSAARHTISTTLQGKANHLDKLENKASLHKLLEKSPGWNGIDALCSDITIDLFRDERLAWTTIFKMFQARIIAFTLAFYATKLGSITLRRVMYACSAASTSPINVLIGFKTASSNRVFRKMTSTSDYPVRS